MKKITLLCALFCTLFAFAQFPEKDPMLLKGHKIKIDDYTPEQLQKLAKYNLDVYDTFFSDIENSIMYKGSRTTETPYAALNGRMLNVTDVKFKDDSVLGRIYWFTLTDGPETIYFKWNASIENPVPFTVLDLNYAPEYWDKYIKNDSGKFKAFRADKKNAFTIDKTFDAKGKVSYTLFVYTNFVPANCETEKGLQFIFEDGEILKLPSAVVDHAFGSLYSGGGTIFDESIIKKLGAKKVVKIKLCATEAPFDHGDVFKNVISRLIETK